jgi:hypothetical protein
MVELLVDGKRWRFSVDFPKTILMVNSLKTKMAGLQISERSDPIGLGLFARVMRW